MAGDELKEDYIKPTVKHGGGGIMVWGCINTRGVGFLSKVDGRLTGEGYINLLGNALILTIHVLGLPSGWILHQDNAICHTSRQVRDWFKEEGISVIDWPTQSPDLKPI